MNDDRILEEARGVLELEGNAVLALRSQLRPNLAEAAQLLLDCEGHVLCTGSGTSHAVAMRFAHLLSCCGTPALFLHPGDSAHGLSGAVTSRDVLFVVSKGGETQEVNQLAAYARGKGAKVVAILESPASTLGRMCDVVICVQAPDGVDPFGMIATGSSLFNSALCDTLCVVLLKMRGYSEQAFSKTHPGGAVGRKIEEKERGGRR